MITDEVTAAEISSIVPMWYVRENHMKNWSTDGLLANRNIAMEDIERILNANIGANRDVISEEQWKILSRRIPINTILANTQYPWSWGDVLRYNPYVRSDTIGSIIARIPGESTRLRAGMNVPVDTWREIALGLRWKYHPSMSIYDWEENRHDATTRGHAAKILPMEYIRANPVFQQEKFNITENPEIRVDDFFALMLDNSGIVWDNLSERVPMQDVRSNPQYPWNKAKLSQNRGITLNDVLNLNFVRPRGEWDWKSLSRIIRIDTIRANPHLPWDPKGILQNPTATKIDIRNLNIV